MSQDQPPQSGPASAPPNAPPAGRPDPGPPPSAVPGPPSGTGDGSAPAEGDGTAAPEDGGHPPEQAQRAWDARRDLIDHSPDGVIGGLVPGSQYGVAGGELHGDINFHFGARTATATLSAEIPREMVEELTGVFAEPPGFAEALGRLRTERCVVIAGPQDTGRRCAALRLLRELGTGHIRSLDPAAAPASLPEQLSRSCGYLLGDPAVSRSRPLREQHLLAARSRLGRHDGLLVITVESPALLDGVPHVVWSPPAPADVLAAHVVRHAGEAAWEALSRCAAVAEFLAHDRRPGEIAGFAERLAAHHRGDIDEETLNSFARTALRTQVTRWLSDGTELRDKAFLLSLAVFDRAPYAVAAELGDELFARLQETEKPDEPPRIPVFGNSVTERLQLARAHGYHENEATEWGPVPQYMAAFQDVEAAETLLRNTWTDHPSARPALVRWLHRLVEDARPLVRTRAAAAAARLAQADLPSAMAHLIEPWAVGRRPLARLAAANTLTLAQLLKAPNISRILHEWCTGAQKELRWTAIRAYGLLGPILPGEALYALVTTARAHPDAPGEDEELAQATQLLLLTARSPVLAELVRMLGDRGVRQLSLRSFMLACAEREDGGLPLILQWHAEASAAEGTEDDRHLAAMWRDALADRAHTEEALRLLREWVLLADRLPEAEHALTRLLPALAVSGRDHQRLSHLLRTMPDADGGRPPRVAARLLAVVSPGGVRRSADDRT